MVSAVVDVNGILLRKEAPRSGGGEVPGLLVHLAARALPFTNPSMTVDPHSSILPSFTLGNALSF